MLDIGCKIVDITQQRFAILNFHTALIFIEGEGDGIKSRPPFKTFSTLLEVETKLVETWAWLLQSPYLQNSQILRALQGRWNRLG